MPISPKKCEVCRDFNCHHKMWVCTCILMNEECFIQALNNTNLIVLSDGTSTKMSKPSENKSAEDLSAVYPNLVFRFTRKVFTDSIG